MKIHQQLCMERPRGLGRGKRSAPFPVDTRRMVAPRSGIGTARGKGEGKAHHLLHLEGKVAETRLLCPRTTGWTMLKSFPEAEYLTNHDLLIDYIVGCIY